MVGTPLLAIVLSLVREDQEDNAGNNALYLLVQDEINLFDYGTALTLLQKGFDPNRTNAEGSTALHLAMIRESHLIFMTLLENGGNVNVLDRKGRTPIFYLRNTSCIQMWMTYEPKLNIKDREGNNAFQYLIRKTRVRSNLFLKLMEDGADYRNVNYINENCLHTIANVDRIYWNNFPVDLRNLNKAIIETGEIDVSATNFRTETPLHIAVRKNPHIVLDFLRAGASIKTLNYKRHTPLDIALADKFHHYSSEAFIKYFVFRRHRGLKVEKVHINQINSKPELNTFIEVYELYMEYLKNQMLITSSKISYYDILCSRREELLDIVRRPGIREGYSASFAETSTYDVEIMEQWKEATETADLQRQMLIILDEIMDTVPYICVKHIVSFLSREDMQLMISNT